MSQTYLCKHFVTLGIVYLSFNASALSVIDCMAIICGRDFEYAIQDCKAIVRGRDFECSITIYKSIVRERDYDCGV